MGQMVRHEMKPLPQRTPKQFVGDTGHLTEPQPESFLKPRIPPLGAIFLSAQLGVERVCDVIDILGGEPGVVQAITDRTLGKLMRIVEIRFLPVLDAIEPLFLDRGNEHAVDEQGCGGLVIHRVDSKNVHPCPLIVLFFLLLEPSQHIEPAGMRQVESRRPCDALPSLQPSTRVRSGLLNP
jgi:hypothetical protein